MTLQYHPKRGTIVICDFLGFSSPEMTKRRPVIVVSPQISNRVGLCTIVPLSTTTPEKIMPYHYYLEIRPLLPPPYNSPFHWVKADMLYTMSLKRLSFPFLDNKGSGGKRRYDLRVLPEEIIQNIEKCILHGLGITY